MTRHEQLADAFVAVATANHYMVGVVERYTREELDAAYQIVIDRDNTAGNNDAALNLALDLMEDAKRNDDRRVSESVQTKVSACDNPAKGS